MGLGRISGGKKDEMIIRGETRGIPPGDEIRAAVQSAIDGRAALLRAALAAQDCDAADKIRAELVRLIDFRDENRGEN